MKNSADKNDYRDWILSQVDIIVSQSYYIAFIFNNICNSSINTSIYITCIFINKKEIKCYVLLGSSCMFLIINILLLYRSLEIKKTFKFNSDVHMKNMA